MTSEDTAFVYLQMPKDVYVEIPFTFTDDFHCVLKLSVYKSWVTRNFCCEYEEVYSLYSFWHHNNKKKLAYKTRQSKSLLFGRCKRRVARKWKGDRNLFYSPYNLLHQICLFHIHFLTSTALLRIHLLFSLRLLIFALETIFSGSCQWELLLSIFFLPIFSHSYSCKEMSAEYSSPIRTEKKCQKYLWKKHVFGPVSFSMQPILETELKVKKKNKWRKTERKKTCKQEARSQFLNAKHLKLHER